MLFIDVLQPNQFSYVTLRAKKNQSVVRLLCGLVSGDETHQAREGPLPDQQVRALLEPADLHQGLGPGSEPSLPGRCRGP